MNSNTEVLRVHGGVDALGAAPFDFSTNSNACGPCPEVMAALQAADATRYPDPAYDALRAQLAHWHGVAPARVVIAASASEFIFRMTTWMVQQGARRVWWPSHAYGDYASAANAWSLLPVARPAQAQLAWACEPSSPLGQNHSDWGHLVLAQDAADEHAATTPSPQWVLDRAYAPLRLSGESSLTTAQLDQLWQLWTPNKALGLTGVRAAYVIAPDTVLGQEAVAGLARLCPSWPVGAHGVAMLQAWTQPSVQQWLAQSLVQLSEWKQRQVTVCEGLGWACAPSHANFFVARPNPAEAAASALPAQLAALRAQGIKLRDAASFGLPGQVRLGVLPPPAQDALARAWASASASVPR